MSSTSRCVLLLTVVAAVGAGAVACGGGSSGPGVGAGGGTLGAAAPTTVLEIVAHGGFAYVYEDQHLEIAYLTSTTGPCTVTQLGTTLEVAAGGGRITSSNPPADGVFNLQGTVVTFPGMDPSGSVVALGVGRPNAPFHPAHPDVETNWRDLKWVPYVRPNYPGSINTNWRTLPLIDGRLVLTDGKIVGGGPSDQGATSGMYRFRRTSDTLTFDQAITDRTKYSVRLPGVQVVVNLTKGGTTTAVTIAPSSSGQPVKLELKGKHSSSASSATIAHFCAFYELLDPVPPMGERFIPTFIDPATGLPCVTGTPGCQPSPGAFCPGDWF